MLDAWPLVRFAMDEPVYVAVIGELFRGPDRVIVSSINLGEVHYKVARRKGSVSADRMWDDVCNRAQVEAPTLELTRAAARLALTSRIPWADAHAAATAIAHGGVLWSGDAHLTKPGPWKRLDLRKPGMPPRAGGTE
ncbi:MAG: type II toxin-antitoxin system VapC family toxin [Acidimicrobiaceae bacterium]|nr:PIN domain-containing protein [Acidimicrobiaceae bacterium]MXW62779.1 type II toxin-antitoxin system VapC family toxin [Acidimicrobiaceae bacterium]MYC43095.1 type II toxin-antitoxin system VapC family toxin [Acidimicrobiaceae bacterium]MYD08261.1 type II toxin-antitoxin system VapC family toxin [Acidimicrobiaceae bacterium]MYH88395.1 type II toxin-antitoxin system VapC family toxin [Acidimicrobiaceae bacterium]